VGSRIKYVSPGASPGAYPEATLLTRCCDSRYLLAGVSLYVVGSFIIEQDFLDDVFIPFPLTTKRLAPQPYKGTDPEWQEFVRIAKDKDLQIKLKREPILGPPLTTG
jgi:hypothetical protein